MASIAQVIRDRRSDLKKLRQLSLTVDAAQEAAEREILRQLNRKRAVPEPADLARIVGLMQAQDQAQQTLATALGAIADKWSGV